MIPLAAVPSLRIEIDGVPLDGPLLTSVSQIRVQQRLSLPTLCELTFLKHDGKDLPKRVFPGASFMVAVDDQRLFQGDLTAIEYSYGSSNLREVHVRGYDRLHRLRKRQSVRVHAEVTPLDLARELVAKDGLTVEAPESGPLFPTLIQYVQSDLELLVEVASRCGWYLVLSGSVLHLVTLAGRGESIRLELGKALLEAKVEANGDAACRSVSAGGWDTSRAEHHQARAESARAGRAVAAQVSPASMNSPGERFLVDEMTENDRHAELLAQAELDSRSAREVTISGAATGDVRLAPGRPIEIEGVAGAFCGRYVLTEVAHIIDAQSGFVSEFSTEPPPLRVRPRGTITALAVVSKVDDPENLGRVRVVLPSYGNTETGWLPVVSAGAGRGKGLVMLPDVDDKVLVLLPRESPAHAIVLGGLYGTVGPPDAGVEQGVVRRSLLRTAAGHRIQFDDALRSLRVEDCQGSYLEFTERQVLLHANTDLKIEAPGHSIIVGAAAIDFVRS